MRKLLVLSMVCFALVMPKAFGWELAWFNYEQILDQNGTPVAPGAMVQLIAAGPNGVVDDPFTFWMAQADPCAAMQAWLAGGCKPVGDDFLVTSIDQPNPQYVQDFGGGTDGWGWYGAVYINSGVPAFGSGVGLYTRFFTAEHPMECDWYGTVTTETGALYQLDNATFPTYMVPGAQVDQHIECPEPATMILGGIGLLLAFFRRKK